MIGASVIRHSWTHFHALRADRRGVALIEFAFTVPILLTMYIGSAELCNGIGAQRKVTTTTRALADLTSQYTVINNAELSQIAAASAQIMAPYNVSVGYQLTITQVKIDGASVAKVDWSYAQGTTPLTVGDNVTMDAALRQPNTYMLVAQVQYIYTPRLGQAFSKPITMRDTIFMSPRGSDFITRI